MAMFDQQGKLSYLKGAIGLALLALAWFAVVEWGKLRPAYSVTVVGFPEISDLAWLPERQSFIAVSDEELIGEVDLEGNVLALKNPGFDLESVTALPGRTDQVMVMDECGGRLLWFSVPELEIVKEQALPESAIIGESCNRQIEGMALHGEDGLVLANEGPARLLFFDRNLEELRKTVSIDAQYISEVIALYDGSLLVVSREAGLRLYSAEGEPLGPWRPVSVGFIEGGDFVPGTGLVLCVDREPSKLLFFPEIRNDPSIKQIFLEQ